MKKRLREKLKKLGRLPWKWQEQNSVVRKTLENSLTETSLQATEVKEGFPFECVLVEAYTKLKELNPNHPLLRPGYLDRDNHFHPSPGYWYAEDISNFSRRPYQRLSIRTREDYCDLGGYILRLRATVRKLSKVAIV